jgi:hypothetical protein
MQFYLEQEQQQNRRAFLVGVVEGVIHPTRIDNRQNTHQRSQSHVGEPREHS